MFAKLMTARVLGLVCLAAGGLVNAPAQASSYQVIYAFTGGSDGAEPVGPVIADDAGNLYGETRNGGAAPCGTQITAENLGCGTVYRLSRGGTMTPLVNFTGPNGAYGLSPLLLDGTHLFGTAATGGTTNNGVLFTVGTDGTKFSLLHQFSGTDGSVPVGALQMGPGRVIYGLTSSGGPGYPQAGYGVLFSLAPDGTYTILHAFSGGHDGAMPTTLLLDSSGVLFGSTEGGGFAGNKSCAKGGCGVIFEYVLSAGKFVVLHVFNGTEGSHPYLGSIGANGTLYGNAGSLFSLNVTSRYTVIDQFGQYDGFGAVSGPAVSANGSLTGTNSQGPYPSSGTLYQYANGTTTVLHAFGAPGDGAAPQAEPMQTKTGRFIGTTVYGGQSCGCGTIYEYTP